MLTTLMHFLGSSHTLSFKVYQMVLGLLYFYYPTSSTRPPRNIGSFAIDKQKAWGFFDGASQGGNTLCDLGFVLYLFDTPTFMEKPIWGKEQTIKVILYHLGSFEIFLQ
jgi:hypothetical protein